MKNLVEERMNDDGLRILSEQEIADSSKRKPILERIKAKLTGKKGFSYNGKMIELREK
jgi:hypothetical protein